MTGCINTIITKMSLTSDGSITGVNYCVVVIPALFSVPAYHDWLNPLDTFRSHCGYLKSTHGRLSKMEHLYEISTFLLHLQVLETVKLMLKNNIFCEAHF